MAKSLTIMVALFLSLFVVYTPPVSAGEEQCQRNCVGNALPPVKLQRGDRPLRHAIKVRVCLPIALWGQMAIGTVEGRQTKGWRPQLGYIPEQKIGQDENISFWTMKLPAQTERCFWQTVRPGSQVALGVTCWRRVYTTARMTEDGATYLIEHRAAKNHVNPNGRTGN